MACRACHRAGDALGVPWTRFLEPALLLLLGQGNAHGYELEVRLHRLLPEAKAVSKPVLYRYLRRMEADGLVEGAWQPGLRGPMRRVYRLTEAGRSHLREWLGVLQREAEALGTFVERCLARASPRGNP